MLPAGPPGLAPQGRGLVRSVLLCRSLRGLEPQGTGQLHEEPWALAGGECLEKAVEEILLVLGLPRRRRRALGWLGVAGGPRDDEGTVEDYGSIF